MTDRNTQIIAQWHRPAAYVIAFDPQGRVLLTRFEKPGHPQSGAWTLPGGGMEWGEQARETARRELTEETGLTAEIGALLGAHSEWFDAQGSDRGEPGHAIRLIFAGHDCVGELKTDFSEDDTTSGAGWFTPDELQNLRRVTVVDFSVALATRKSPATYPFTASTSSTS